MHLHFRVNPSKFCCYLRGRAHARTEKHFPNRGVVQMFMAFTHMVLRAKKQSQNRAEREREREKNTVNIGDQRDRDRRKRGKKCC